MTVDIEALRRVLAAAEHEARVLALLTDEELAAIDADIPDEAVTRPWIDDQNDVTPELAARFGLRSLLVRGIVRPSDDDPDHYTVDPEVRMAVEMRRAGVGLIRAERASGPAVCLSTSVQPELGAFEESVSRAGMHLFSACGYELAAQRLADWVLEGCVHGVAPTRDTRMALEDWPDLLATTFSSEPRTSALDLYLPQGASPAELRHWTVATDEDHAVLLRPELPAGQTALARPTSSTDLAELLLDTIERAVHHP